MVNTDPGPVREPPIRKGGKRDTVSEIIALLTQLNEVIKQGGKGLSHNLRRISAELDQKIPYRDEHSARVADICLAVAQRLKLSAEERKALEIAALLHDFGKIGVEEDLLSVDRRLTPDERQEIEEHVLRGYYILDGFPEIAKALRGLKEHHEHWDGRGYPEGLRGEAICVQARIIAVVDAFDAMVTDRPYRARLSKKEALFRLEESAGRHFDPRVVDAFAHLAQREKLLEDR
jgi:HD-GYP domain-containing protein (c-di-GMP phosphodiesterase class II)